MPSPHQQLNDVSVWRRSPRFRLVWSWWIEPDRPVPPERLPKQLERGDPQPPGPRRAVSGSQVASSGHHTSTATISTMIRNIGSAVLAI